MSRIALRTPASMLCVLALSLAAGGCGSLDAVTALIPGQGGGGAKKSAGGPDQLQSDAFKPAPNTPPMDHPEAAMYNSVHVGLLPTDAPAAASAVTGGSSQVADLVKPVPSGARPATQTSGAVPAVQATTAQAGAAQAGGTRPPAVQGSTTGPSPDTYLVLGFVVAEVNGTPIYANRILATIRGELVAKAKQLDRAGFRVAAEDQIRKQLASMEVNELEVAAADTGLNEQEKKLADALTTDWRAKQITRAGGSYQLARARAAADGDNFDDRVAEEHRANLVRVFYRKKIVPLIVITPDDMRQYYKDHLKDQFTQYGEATFDLAHIAPGQDGDRSAALAAAKDVRDRLLGGVKFKDLNLPASTDDAGNGPRVTGQPVGPIQKGAFVLEKVEDAVWQTPNGGVTDVVEDRGGFYVAKLTALKQGKVQPFDDLAVQDAIHDALFREQFTRLRQRVQEDLRHDAVIRGGGEDQVTIAVDMAMQNYDGWSK